jgi:diguanylate cyclase (GGDEF)-like protein
VISLKLKLVLYFLVLSLLPLAAVFWGATSAATSRETRRVDDRLHAGLRASVAALDDELALRRGLAERLAADDRLHRALADRNGPRVRALLAGTDGIAVRGRVAAGRLDPSALKVTVTVRRGRATLGRVVAQVPFDETLRRALERRSGLPHGDRLVLLRGGAVVGSATPARLAGREGPGEVTLDGHPHRALAIAGIAGQEELGLAAVSPQGGIDEAKASTRRGLLMGLVASLLLIALVGYIEGLSIVRTIRRFVRAAETVAHGRLDERLPSRSRDEFGELGRAFNDMADQLGAERRRLRQATMRFGEVLAATHDQDQLLRAIVETAVETARARGGVIVDDTGELVRHGDVDPGGSTIRVPLSHAEGSFGTLVLNGDFTPDDEELAASLAAHAVIALENARLHAIVERQALVDGLTGLANRRHCERALATELARSERTGAPFALVLADVDRFKVVNDTHGHPAGDEILRGLGARLEEGLRETDLAARWGGEEFALLLPGTGLQEALAIVERIRLDLVGRPFVLESGVAITVTASFGVAAVPPSSGADELLGGADAALYAAKRGGRNRVEAFGGPALAA